jgi:membrane-associated phospholipid phosphatase
MPLLLLLVLSVAAGLLAALLALRVTTPTLRLRLAVAIGGGLLLGVLAYLVHTNARLIRVDNSVAEWANRHASAWSAHALDAVTQLGGIYAVIALAVVLAVAATVAERSVWVATFFVAVIGGEEILTLTVKDLTDRRRPTFNPVAATLSPAFPSGHSATAAAFYAGAALVLARHRSRSTQAVLTGLAVGIAVAVAASRVLLDLHWLSDVIAGLALGWAWFAVCAIAFGGRLLRTTSLGERRAGSSPGRGGRAAATRRLRGIPRAPRPSCPRGRSR